MDPATLIPRPDAITVPWGWFEVLLLVTFVAHLLFMNTVLGTVLISAWRELARSGEPGQAVKDASTKTPAALALTINLAVPPLLFAQVLYGQFLYTSTILMGAWWLSLIGVVILAYYGLYLYDFKFDSLGPARLFLIGGVALLLLFTAFMLVNNMTLELRPDRWAAYFDRPDGTLLNLGEPTLAPRYLHFVTASVAVGGLWLAVLGSRAQARGEVGARARVESGMACFLYATLVQLVVGVWFLLSLPREVMLSLMTRTPHVIFFTLALLGALACLATGFKRAVWPAVISLAATVSAMAVVRELVRLEYLSPWFRPADLTVVPQYSPLVLFLAALAVGLGAIAWMLRLAARAGKEG